MPRKPFTALSSEANFAVQMIIWCQNLKNVQRRTSGHKNQPIHALANAKLTLNFTGQKVLYSTQKVQAVKITPILKLNGRQYDYGARFYDPVIGRWGVVDLMTENHYDLNSYNYVLNNPLRLVDHNGMDTSFSDAKSRNMVRKYSDKFKRDKKGNLTDKKNGNYNEAFADIISKQVSAKENYDYSFDESGKIGSVSYDGQSVNVTIADAGENYGIGAEGVLFEEVKHTDQFMNGEINFTNSGDHWQASNTISIEVAAKQFVASQLSINSYSTQNGLSIPTQLGFIKSHDAATGALYLMNGLTNFNVFGDNGKRGVVNIDGPYSSLSGVADFKNTFKVRTENSKIFVYPPIVSP